ncbi:DUF5131 family protein [Faecalispora jeddahensis]|uniref:DUF5131 family protein n=1 Tax=Faecalispora jeddahensis TaxID=1414721 RepID=UPI0018990001|nr:DUF5131 family protein [Faecalispora jeddahensis]
MNETKIEWCEKTLNPVVGCSFGCPYCYARRLNTRFKWVEDFSEPQFFPERLSQLKGKGSHSIFMDSMSDVADWKYEWAQVVYKAIYHAPQHHYIFLSKRPESYFDLFPRWFIEAPNIWLGTTVTEQNDIERLGSLPIKCNRFISIEPLRGPINLDLRPYRVASPLADWVIIGAETGNGPGKVIPRREWVDEIVKYCDTHKIPVFMKDSLLQIMGAQNLRRDFPSEL